MTTFTKQPSEVLDYDIDMQSYLEEIDDEISGVTPAVITVDNVTVPPLEIGPGSHPESEALGTPKRRLKIWIGGGLDGQKYKVTALITTADGRVEETEFQIRVKET